ncbi:sister chromatid cohesion protein PDS5 homolog B-like [Adelges cooleyi]|uniref:sister chromatid cohesion protein PDS5 homolog B-like n=1 Tax=Adelges cooleyi TaxID=133065 RepID=UPI00217FF17E|nr:sister chromatid cohesion protein PDS5 homolog B-like [Adelges cooleyi]
MEQYINYPPGCRPVTSDLGSDELIRRLKILAHTFQNMAQNEAMCQQYVPLTIYLVQDFFLKHPSKDVQLLTACCIADVLRIFAPEAPYTNPEQVKGIFMFLIKQLGGLKDPKNPAFKRYFYLLENLAYVKSFNMCFDLEDCQEIFCKLFSLLFQIINDEHSAKVKVFMLDILCPLIMESDVISNELLDIILINIVEPNKSHRKNTYSLVKDLIIKCSDSLEPYIQAFFNQSLMLGQNEKNLAINSKTYDLIYELNKISKSILLAVLPLLECKLKSTVEQERSDTIALLASMFSEKESNIARRYNILWHAFLSRFNDLSINIRIKCVQCAMQILVNQSYCRPDLIEALRLRSFDHDMNVRYETILAIVSTAKTDFESIAENEELFLMVKDRMCDKKFKIRREAVLGLAYIYKTYLNGPEIPNATKKAFSWIKDKILHGYYRNCLEDKLLVEQIVNSSLVPYQLPPDVKMKRLYHLYGTVDEYAKKAFIEIQKNQMLIRSYLKEFVNIHKKADHDNKELEIQTSIKLLTRYLPEPVKANEFINKFSQQLRSDANLLNYMDIIVKQTSSTAEVANAFNFLLKKLGKPNTTNVYYNTLKALLERALSVMIDSQSLKVLFIHVENCLNAGHMVDELGLHPGTAGYKGLELLNVLSNTFACHFYHPDILDKLIHLLHYDDVCITTQVLTVLTTIGKYSALGDSCPELTEKLTPMCEVFSIKGTPKQAKCAIRCLFVNVYKSKTNVFDNIVEKTQLNLTPESEYYETAIVAFGHLALNVVDKYSALFSNIISKKIVRELLATEITHIVTCDDDDDWCQENRLPKETKCRVEGIKALARWVVGLKNDKQCARKTFRIFSVLLSKNGDLMESGMLTKPELAWLRLQAGCAMLKICEQKEIGDQYTAEQFFLLSRLMTDEVLKVREIFAEKLHKGLGRGSPFKCLPLDFMGMYVFGGLETDKNLKTKIYGYLLKDTSRRQEYIKILTQKTTTCSVDRAMEQLPHILPDYMVLFAISILTHSPVYTDCKDIKILTLMQQCLWFILEPLITKNDSYNYGFYKAMLEKLKCYVDAVDPTNEAINTKMWTLCDLTMNVVVTHTTTFESAPLSEIKISSMFYKRHEDSLFTNIKVYLPEQFQIQQVNNDGRKIKLSALRTPKTRVQKHDRQAEQSQNSTVVNKNNNTFIEASDDEEKITPQSKRRRTCKPCTTCNNNIE